MMFFDEAVQGLSAGLTKNDGWTEEARNAHLGQVGGDRIEWWHEASQTRLSVTALGGVFVYRERLLLKPARFTDALQTSDSMDKWIELAKALATREKDVLLKWFRPAQLHVRG